MIFNQTFHVRTVRRFLAAVAAGAVLAGTGIGYAGHANAAPGQCGSAIVGGNGGGFCDYPPRPDGTWYHCESVYVLGFGGTNCFYVRPVPTDVDPRGWVPA
ncbi:hypothetical protein [Mycolicibacterium conceptionense]|uniref:CDGP domain-containing protein n=1 Tax=Mycolicibacterium conceptionense TaxID=451644 RepID=UPI0007ED1774|nr:hypothetical protein A5639_12000 [Mycolicibacterium conceptionense]